MSSIMRWRRGLVVAIGASCPERGGCDHHILSDGRFHRSDLPAAPKEQVRSIPGRIASRLLRLFLRDADGRRPVNGGNRRFDQDPAWSDLRLRSATWSSRQRKARGGAETRWRSRKGINPFTKEPAIFKAKPARKIIRAHPVKAAKDAVS